MASSPGLSGVIGVKVDGIISSDSTAQAEPELRTPDSGYSSVSSNSSSRFLGNSLEVHAEETEQGIRAVSDQPQESRSEVKKANSTLKERKRSNTDDDSVSQSSQKVLCDLPPSVKSLVPGANSELVEKAKSIVEKAVKQHKVYVMFGQYGTVKRGLKRRGWLEKPCDCCRVSRTAANAKKSCDQELTGKGDARFDLESIISKLLIGVTPNLIMVVNKFPHAHFTTKIGIHSCLQNLHWFTNFSMNTFFPRCYQVFTEEERKAFIEDYRLTACMNVLKWFVSTFTEQVERLRLSAGSTFVKGNQGIEGKSGRVRRTLIDFSIARCEEFLRSREHIDLDLPAAQLWEHQWEQFLTEYYSLTQGGAKIQVIGLDLLMVATNFDLKTLTQLLQ